MRYAEMGLAQSFTEDSADDKRQASHAAYPASFNTQLNSTDIPIFKRIMGCT